MTALEACEKIEGAINDLHEETATRTERKSD